MSVQVTKYNCVAVLTPKDDLVGDEVESFRHRATQCVGEKNYHVVMDFSVVGAFDSAALEAMIDLQNACESDLGTVKLCGLDATCAKILDITRLARRFEIFDDLESAVKSFS